MARSNHHTLLYIYATLSVVLAAALAACGHGTAYNHFHHVPVAGWEKNDTLTFAVPSLPTGGMYREELALRISGDYPFMGLSLIVEQTVLPSHATRCDTLSCQLIDHHGNAVGRGVSQYQYAFPLPAQKLAPGDSLRIAVRHDMKRDILPGITDIGIRLRREN
ncbi:MAG: gliding motility lipoprotein GldH [Prevotella sp.]|nr:gliding motility lipoprotein GldH [Prevotella sp.]